MAAGSAVKQNYWLVGISHETFPPSAALMVSAFNTAFNSMNSLLFVCQATSASVNGEHFPQIPLLVGAGLYTIGILTESISEWQRKNFKADPANKGKVYRGGLFSLARHINYGGYTLWRCGYSLAAGGWVWGAAIGAFFFWDFSHRAIPVLSQYCEDRVRLQLRYFYQCFANPVHSMASNGSSTRHAPHGSFCHMFIESVLDEAFVRNSCCYTLAVSIRKFCYGLDPFPSSELCHRSG